MATGQTGGLSRVEHRPAQNSGLQSALICLASPVDLSGRGGCNFKYKLYINEQRGESDCHEHEVRDGIGPVLLQAGEVDGGAVQ